MTFQRNFASSIVILFTAFVISACQSEPPPPTATPTPLQPTETPTDIPFKAVGTDFTINLPIGDPVAGQKQAGFRGCVACHGTGVGPNWAPSDDLVGIGDRASIRLTQENYTGAATNAEQYLFESIVQPSAHIVEGYTDGIMISQSGRLMSAQDVADVIAYLLTIR